MQFMQGRVFIHTKKGLRLANISFDGSSGIDHAKRLTGPKIKVKRRQDSPSKHITSPFKDNHEVQIILQNRNNSLIIVSIIHRAA